MIIKLLTYLITGFISLLALGILFALLRWNYVRVFRRRLCRQVNNPTKPIIANIYVGEEKYNCVVRKHEGWRFTVEYKDEHGIQHRSVHLNDLYPAW